MGFPRLDMVFSLSAPAVDVLVKNAGVAGLEISDDEARVRPFGADLDAGDDALDAAPAFGAVEKLLEAASFAALGRRLEARLCAGLKPLDMPAERRCRRDAENEVQPFSPTPVENLRRAVMA